MTRPLEIDDPAGDAAFTDAWASMPGAPDPEPPFDQALLLLAAAGRCPAGFYLVYRCDDHGRTVCPECDELDWLMESVQ